MKRGKRICSQLKSVRRAIAEANDIPLEQHECTHQGDCRGTCPYCEAEVRYLERELERRRARGRAAVVAGIAMSLPLAGCSDGNNANQQTPPIQPLPTSETSTQEIPQDSVPEPPDTEWPDLTLDGLIVCGEEVEFVDSTQTKGCEKPPAEAIIDDDEMIEGEPDPILVGMVMEDEPVFPGGQAAFDQYLAENIHYPELARQNNVEGMVYIEFVIEEDGSVSNAVIKRDIGSGCGEEALRAVLAMPKWQPAKQYGKRVRTSYIIPIEFKLDD